MNQKGNFAEIFQYTDYADTKRFLFTATDRRQAKWMLVLWSNDM